MGMGVHAGWIKGWRGIRWEHETASGTCPAALYLGRSRLGTFSMPVEGYDVRRQNPGFRALERVILSLASDGIRRRRTADTTKRPFHGD